MMAKPAASLDVPVTKTTGGIVVLPACTISFAATTRHGRMCRESGDRRATSAASAPNSARAFCSGIRSSRTAPCSRSDFRAVRMRWWRERFTAANATCARCSRARRISIPSTVCVQAKPLARERGLVFKGSAESVIPHPMAEFRRVPMRRLIARLGLSEFNNTGPLVDHVFSPNHVNILLKQHAGAPAVPLVKSGDRVRGGDLLAMPEPGKLGAPDPCQHGRPW